MRVTGYDFGRIVVDGRTYDSDLIIFADRVRDGWWRRHGHSLCLDDLAEVVAAGPEVLVIGTGYYGRMAVPAATRAWLESRGIEVREALTREAVQEFNRLQEQCARVVAALHLTC